MISVIALMVTMLTRSPFALPIHKIPSWEAKSSLLGVSSGGVSIVWQTCQSLVPPLIEPVGFSYPLE